MPYKPKIGDDFALTKVIIAETRRLTEFTRSAIALSIVAVALAVLLITATICAYRADFKALETLWAVIAAPLGCIVGYYFRRH